MFVAAVRQNLGHPVILVDRMREFRGRPRLDVSEY